MYLFFDTETTGLPRNWKAPVTDLVNWPRMVQLAWIECAPNGDMIRSHEHIVKPENYEIPAETANIHGITTEIALARGRALEEVLKEFSAALSRAEFLVAHNMSFDEKIVGAEFIRKGNKDPMNSVKQFCTKILSTNFCKLPSRYGYKWPTLQELHTKLFGAPFESAHNAAIDVAACRKCFFELKRLGVIPEPFAGSPG